MQLTDRKTTLATYLSVAAGASCIGGNALGAVVFYGVNSANDTNADPLGINFGSDSNGYLVSSGASVSESVFATQANEYFTNGVDFLSSPTTNYTAEYFRTDFGVFYHGSRLGDQNYANISFNGDDGVYEAVAQFNFDGAGGGFLVAIATTNAITDPSDLSGVGGPALSVSAGKALIDAAAVPEPSALALLGMGAAGVLARRRRKAA